MSRNDAALHHHRLEPDEARYTAPLGTRGLSHNADASYEQGPNVAMDYIDSAATVSEMRRALKQRRA